MNTDRRTVHWILVRADCRLFVVPFQVLGAAQLVQTMPKKGAKAKDQTRDECGPIGPW